MSRPYPFDSYASDHEIASHVIVLPEPAAPKPPYTPILEEALNVVFTAREEDYGDPAVMCDKIAQFWSVILGAPVEARQVPLCMVAFKIVRELNKHKRDNLVDIAGYAEVASRVEERRQ